MLMERPCLKLLPIQRSMWRKLSSRSVRLGKNLRKKPKFQCGLHQHYKSLREAALLLAAPNTDSTYLPMILSAVQVNRNWWSADRLLQRSATSCVTWFNTLMAARNKLFQQPFLNYTLVSFLICFNRTQEIKSMRIRMCLKQFER